MGAMTPTPSAGAPSPFPSIANWRDLGYWIGFDEKIVRPGVVYRTNDFAEISDADRAGLAALELKTIVDLRTQSERSASPDPKFTGTREVVLDVLADNNTPAMAASLDKVLADPKTVHAISEALTVDKAKELMTSTYLDFINLDSAKKSFSTFYQDLLAHELTPTVFHCTTGKDRTGWTAATFLSLLGVDRSDVYREYLLTNDRLVPSLKPVFDEFAAAGGDPALLQPILGVDKVYLDTAFGRLEEVYGTVERYFDEGLGIDLDAQKALRARFLVDPV